MKPNSGASVRGWSRSKIIAPAFLFLSSVLSLCAQVSPRRLMQSFCTNLLAIFSDPRIHSCCRIRFAALFLVYAFVLSGCTLLPIKNLQPVIAPPAGACAKTSDPVRLLLNETPTPGKLQYLRPDADKWVAGGGPRPVLSDSTFADYSKNIETTINNKLPSDLANHPVTIALRKFFTAISAEAQLDAQVAVNNAQAEEKLSAKINTHLVTSEHAAIQKFNTAPKLKHAELKDFAKKLFNLQLKHGPADFMGQATNKVAMSTREQTLAGARPQLKTEFVAYLKAYYDGQFYDRMGTAVSKPALPSLSNPSSFSNFSVPDSEIVAAETVMIEFILDYIDPTPVMGNDPDPGKATMFWPGASPNKPTALATGLGGYVMLPATSVCGINQKNVWVLKDLANAASDEAASVGGLIVNTPGGIVLLGKISIGDNQTLSDLVKTAASELALRATLATSYLTLRNVTFNPPKF
jgi:hypothetical protein